MKDAIKLTRKDILTVIIAEVLYGLQNDNEFLKNSLWLGLFDDTEREDFYNEEKTLFIEDKDGNGKHLGLEEVDDLIYDKIADVQNIVDESLESTNGSMIILINE